jgi:integrase
MIFTLASLIPQIKPLRNSLLRYLSEEKTIYPGDAQELLTDSVSLLHALMNLPVSKLSLLKDMVWDFNSESAVLARSIQGAKSMIDFGYYKNLNSTILFELKIAMLCALEIPGALRSKGTNNYKPHTVLDIFKSVIPFIDKMCARKRNRQGDEFFELTHYSLADFSEEDYKTEAKKFDRAFRQTTNQGLNFLSSHFLQENLFAKPLCVVDFESLDWTQNSITSPKSRNKKKYLENKIFEKCSRKASFAIVDFLKALNEPVSDQLSLESAALINHNEAARFKLTQTSFDIYIAIRLTSRGYTGQEIESLMYSPNREYWSPTRQGMLKDKEAICKLTDTQLNDDFYYYITHISNSALYIIAQYTGMRPSELCGIMADKCLTTNDFGHNLIKSTVIKNQEIYGGLFGDKWAAIPIVLDAVRTLRILNKFKRNPYLLTSMITVLPETQDSANSLSGPGMTYQICAFMAVVLTFEELETIDVSAYTLRHSLAHQMFRASVGLPFISFQLKHFGNLASSIGQNRFSATTIDYGGIGDALVSGQGRDGEELRHEAEKELIVNTCDPDGGFAGDNAGAHRAQLTKYFKGYLEQGYSKDDIFDRMVEQNFAIINVGQGYCYGNATEELDDSLPCIGSLRCNPNRCKNAVVTKANAPKWREIYVQNSIALSKIESFESESMSKQFETKEHERSVAQLKLAISEAKSVLEGLGEELLV